MTWAELCENPALKDLPFKIETDERGNIIMSPAKGRHGAFQAKIAQILNNSLPDGLAFTECPVDTTKGTKVPDVGWYRRDRIKPHFREASFPIAPDICVEILSESNSQEEIDLKKRSYFEKGAVEFWTCDDQGVMTFENSRAALDSSALCPDFPRKLEL